MVNYYYVAVSDIFGAAALFVLKQDCEKYIEQEEMDFRLEKVKQENLHDYF